MAIKGYHVSNKLLLQVKTKRSSKVEKVLGWVSFRIRVDVGLVVEILEVVRL